MTVSSAEIKKTYSGNDVTVAFSFPIYFLKDADLTVQIEDADENVTTKTLTTDYTVSGAGTQAGGTVTMDTAPATGETLIIFRAPEDVQETDFQDFDIDPADAKEDAFDLRTMISQRQAEQLTRSWTMKESSSFTNLVVPEPEADKYLGWDSTGTKMTNKEIVSSGSIAIPLAVSDGGTGAESISGAQEVLGVVPGEDVLVPSSNLSDLDNAATARTNLGLEFADQSTAETGTNNTDIMTALRTYQQITARIADQSTAETGTNNTGMMTPLRVAQAISALVSTGLNVEFQKQTTNVSSATDYTYSSLGFTPKLVLCIAYQPTDPNACSVGFSADESSAEFCLYGYGNASSPTASFMRGGSVLAYARSHGDYGQQLTVKTWGSDSLVVTANKATSGAYSTDFYLYIIG